MIGIIGAMEDEVNELISIMKTEAEASGETIDVKNIATMNFYIGKIKGKEIVLVHSGIGKVNAASTAQILISVFNVDAIINTGIAGSLNAKIDIGDIVLSTDAMEHDIDMKFGMKKGDIQDQETSIYKADDNIREKAKKAFENACKKENLATKIYEGRILSGDQFIDEYEVKEELVSTFNGICCEMEGAAIAHVAWLNNTPFLIVRSISDKADGSLYMDYFECKKIAIKNSVTLITELMSVL